MSVDEGATTIDAVVRLRCDYERWCDYGATTTTTVFDVRRIRSERDQHTPRKEMPADHPRQESR